MITRFLWGRLFCWAMHRLGWAVMLYPDHFGHQAGDVEFDLRTKKQKLLYLAGVIPNKALRRIHSRRATVIDIPDWLRVYFLEVDIAYGSLDERLSRDLVFYGSTDIWRQEPAQKFSKDEEVYGRKVLKELGLEHGKYICFHARDSRYGSLHHPEVIKKRESPLIYRGVSLTEDDAFQRHRNVDFSLYYATVKWLGTQGLKAVRVGSDVERPYAYDNLVDYASLRGSFDDPELIDLYLMANCRLYVGHGSGVTQMSCMFNTPGVCVNWFPYLPSSRPTANITACRVKKLKVLGNTLSEFQSRHFFELANWPQIYDASEEIEVIDNTPEEILETVQKALKTDVRKAA